MIQMSNNRLGEISYTRELYKAMYEYEVEIND